MTNDGSAGTADLPDLGGTLAQVWGLYCERIWLLLTVGGLGAAGSIIVTFLPFPLAIFLRGLIPTVPLLILTGLVSASAGLWGASWAQVAMIEALLDPRQKPTWAQCYRVSWPKIARFSWVSILFFIVFAGGIFPFVLPGVFLGVAFAFAPVAAVAEDASGWSAMTRSFDLVSQRWWGVVLRLGLAGLVASLPARVPWLGWILGPLAAPFAMVAAVVVYNGLRGLPPREAPASAWPARLALCFAALGLCVDCALAVRTVPLVVGALPRLEERYQFLTEHPEKAQEALALLNGAGASPESIAYQLLQSSTAAAGGFAPLAPATTEPTKSGGSGL